MAKRPSLSSSNPEVLMKLLEEEAAPFKIGIEDIIHNHLQTLNKSYNRIQKLLVQTSLIRSYKRLGRLHEVENDHVVFNDSSNALQKDIQSSIEVAQNITTIFKSILPRHTLDYVSDNKKFFLANFSKTENLKVSKFQKKTDYVRNKIVEVAVKLYNLRTSRLQRCIAKSVKYGLFRKYGNLKDVGYMEDRKRIQYRNNNGTLENVDYIEIITEERDEIMIKIEKAMKDLEGILFGIYVMVQTQTAISAYAISEKWCGGTGHHANIHSLAAAVNKKKWWWWWWWWF